jgi:dTDP-4-amino-4,6-dideoxygalactose transaminase
MMLAILGGTPVRSRPFPSWPVFGDAEEKRLLRVLRSGNWGRLHGTEVEQFESRFAAMHGCRHGIAVVNGTVSLRIALLAAGIEAGDEVIVPPYTFISTASAVVEANAVPVFADIDLHTFNIDPGGRRGGCHAAHARDHPGALRGPAGRHGRHPAIAAPRGIAVIEDAAHAHGARLGTRPPGRSATSRRSRSSRARTSRRGRAAFSPRTTTGWRRRAGPSTTAGACRAASGTSTTSSPETTGSASSRARC